MPSYRARSRRARYNERGSDRCTPPPQNFRCACGRRPHGVPSACSAARVFGRTGHRRPGRWCPGRSGRTSSRSPGPTRADRRQGGLQAFRPPERPRARHPPAVAWSDGLRAAPLDTAARPTQEPPTQVAATSTDVPTLAAQPARPAEHSRRTGPGGPAGGRLAVGVHGVVVGRQRCGDLVHPPGRDEQDRALQDADADGGVGRDRRTRQWKPPGRDDRRPAGPTDYVPGCGGAPS
jgi:hypothetical protein